MKIREIEAYFETLYPKDRGCSWDNDGLLICSDREKNVEKVLTCLDVTFHAIEKAIAENCQLIISHHPMIFSPVKNITEDSIVGQKILLLLEAGISLLSLHTRFDCAIGGLNERFAKDLGIFVESDVILLEEEPYVGGIGNLTGKMSPREFASVVSRVLECPVKLYSADMDVRCVGFCCGSGKDLIFPTLSRGADVFVGGDIPYHSALDAVEKGMSVIDCGHHGSEKKSVKIFREDLYAFSSDI
ncbi:MAG: Nif3-like dinuclear metal center hexameric protein, partial [Clostridia bacterium]|nr:Nif3-like dinuclear metal center hexameric protein [Clostridia bacterium]